MSREKFKTSKEIFGLLIMAIGYYYILTLSWIISIIKEIKKEAAKWYE